MSKRDCSSTKRDIHNIQIYLYTLLLKSFESDFFLKTHKEIKRAIQYNKDANMNDVLFFSFI